MHMCPCLFCFVVCVALLFAVVVVAVVFDCIFF